MPNNSGSINGWPTTTTSERAPKLIQGWVDADAATFLECLGLPNGWRQHVVATLIAKLVPELKARGLTEGFEPNNKVVLLAVLEDLNFKPKKKAVKK